MNCFFESNCKAAYGQPTSTGCRCVMDSNQAGKDVNVDARKVSVSGSGTTGPSCTLDRLCVEKAHGMPSAKGCFCGTNNRLLNLSAGESCDLLFSVNSKTCSNKTNEQALREIRQSLGHVWPLLEQAKSQNCDLGALI